MIISTKDRMEDHNGPLLDLRWSHAGPDIISLLLRGMPLRERFICAMVCKTWAEAATAATHSIILKHRMQDVSGLQTWLEKHGNQVTVLQLHECDGAVMSALPCCAKLQDLLLHGTYRHDVSIASRTWGDIASANQLTSVSLSSMQTASQQADVVSALTALPNLQRLTWCCVSCSGKQQLSDSLLLQQMTRLTCLVLRPVTAAALQHLGSLTKLQHLSISAEDEWHAAGCPGLQELKALTSLFMDDLPASASHLTALRQLDVHRATPTALQGVHVLPNLTRLCVVKMTGMSPESPPLKLPGLQHLLLQTGLGVFAGVVTMPMSFLASCTQLQVLKLQGYDLKGPGSLVASTTLQYLELIVCTISAADGAAGPASWQQVFPGPGLLPHLTRLKLNILRALPQADIDGLVECCSNLQVLRVDALEGSSAAALACLPRLTNLHLSMADDECCSALAQLTGLQKLAVWKPGFGLCAVGLRQLAALNQLTSLVFGCFRHSQLDFWATHLMKVDMVDLSATDILQDDFVDCSYAIINKVC